MPIGKNDTDIDHILVGPGGIFTINTKHHCGKHIWVGARTVTVSGHKKAYLPAAEHEAERVTTVLRERMPLVAPVQPVIALVDPKQITFRDKPVQVKVLDARSLRRWLLNAAAGAQRRRDRRGRRDPRQPGHLAPAPQPRLAPT